MKQSDLKRVYSPVPQNFHNALHNAAHSVQEEKPVKKISTLVLACILVLALACGTALAIANYYSVRQYQAGDEPSTAFEKNITELNQTFENDYITFALTDAVFDGEGIALAMNIEAKDSSKPVYLYPRLTATCNGRALDLDIQGMRGDFTSGFMIPMQAGADDRAGQYGFDATLYEDQADGDVTWTFTMQVLAPNWPIRNEDAMPHGEEPSVGFEEFTQRFRDAYAQHEILTTWGESLVEYAAMLPVPEGMTEEEFHKMRLGDQLAQSEAFTLVDTIVSEFDTVMPEDRWQDVGAGLSFPLDAYTVEFAGMNLSFMRVAYVFDMVFPAEMTVAKLEALATEQFDYELYDQKGEALDAGGFSSKKSLERADGAIVLRVEGAANFHQDVPTEITFIPGTRTETEWKPDDTLSFSIPVTLNDQDAK